MGCHFRRRQDQRRQDRNGMLEGLATNGRDKNILILFCNLLADVYGADFVSIAIWIWIGERRVVAALSRTHRNGWFKASVVCQVCGPSTCRERHIALPQWITVFEDLVRYNSWCWQCMRQQYETNATTWMARHPLEEVVRAGFWTLHKRICLCSMCQSGRAIRRKVW